MRRLLTSLLLATLGAMLLVGIMASTAFAQTTPDPDSGVAGTSVTRTEGQGTATGQLPYTGSDGTPSLVLIGLSAIAVGGVIVVGVRRRQAVLQRA